MQPRAGRDLDALSDLCATAAERVANRLTSAAEGGLPGASQRSVGMIAEVLPMLVRGYFLSLVGESAILERFGTAMRRFGGDRARATRDLEGFVRVAVSVRTTILERLIAEIGDSVDAETKLDLLLGMTEASDHLFSEYILGYAEELVALQSERDPVPSTVAGSLQTGLAMGDLDGMILYANPTFGRLLGIPGELVVGRPWKDVVSQNGPSTLLETAKALGEAWEQLETGQENGTRVLRLGMRVVDDRFHVVLIDASGQVQIEQERRAFLRGLMHDIRSPLTLMSGWANTLLREDGEIPADTRRRALETIMRAAKQVGSLTENLLELDLVGTGHDLRRTEFELGGRLRDLSYHAGTEQVAIECNEPVTALGDPEAFDRVLTNLLDNALLHGRTPVCVRVTCEPDHVQVAVEDAGTCDRAHIEEAFDGRVKSSNGFGLGLHASHQLVKAMGGTITLESSDPTRFSVTLTRGC